MAIGMDFNYCGANIYIENELRKIPIEKKHIFADVLSQID